MTVNRATSSVVQTRAIGIRRDACHVHTTRGQFHDEQDVVRDKPSQRGHLDREEVSSGQSPPVRLQKCTPRRSFTSFVSGLDSVFLEDVRDRSSGDFVAEIAESAFDSGVPPSRVLSSHAKHQVANVLHHAWSSRAPPSRAEVPFPRDQLPVPGQDRVRGDDRRHLSQDPPTERLPLRGQPPTFVIAQTKSPSTELSLQDAVLVDEVVDDILLVTVDPAGNGDDEESPRVNGAHAERW